MKKNLGTIKVRIIKLEEAEKVIDFYEEHYYRDEPLCSSEPKMVHNGMNRQHLLKCIAAGTSVLVVEENPQGEEILIGVNTGIVKGPESVQGYYDDSKLQANTKYGQILKIMAVSNEKADIFKRYDVQEIFYIFFICVHRDYRGHGLATLMITEIMALAKKLGYKLSSIDCSSFYSAQAAERLGWDLCNKILYKDYLDESGKQIFVLPPPHLAFKTLAVRL